MILTEAQNQIALDTHRFRVIDCGRRFGKTTLAIEEIKGQVFMDRNDRIAKLPIPLAEREKMIVMSNNDEYRCRVNYWAETYKDARDIAWGMMLKEFRGIIIKRNEQRLELIVRNREGKRALIKLRGWESVESQRGQHSDFDLYDEAAKYANFWSNWSEILRPTFSDFMGQAIFFSTPKGFNHFYDLYGKEAVDPDFKSFHFTSYDNPFIALSELAKAKASMTEDQFAQEYLADFRKTEGLVYKEFNRQIHLFDYNETPEDNLIMGAYYFAGADPGFTNPAAVIHVKKDRNGVYWVCGEYYKTGQTDAEVASYIASAGFSKVFPDPAAPEFIKELRSKGVNTGEVVKGKDSIKTGINVLRELFKANRLRIHRKCINLISELETYSYPDKREGKNEDENPADENNHALDALRYAITSQQSTRKAEATIFIPTGLNRTAIQRVAGTKEAVIFNPNVSTNNF